MDEMTDIVYIPPEKVQIVAASDLLTAIKKVPPDEDLVVRVLEDTLATDDLSMHKFLLQQIVLCHVAICKTNYDLAKKLADRINIDETFLADLFFRIPDLVEGFEVKVENSLKVIYYQGDKGSGKRNDAYMSTAFNNLHTKLIQYIGTKNVTHSTIAKAIIKWSDWEIIRPRTYTESSLIDKVISRAEYLIYDVGKRKITVPLIKQDKSLKDVSSKKIKEILLSYGWEIVRLGTSKTLYFKPKNTDND